jgi:hypothetical protein
MREVSDTHQNSLHRKESAIATVWLAFYALAVLVAFVPSLVSRAIEIAAR